MRHVRLSGPARHIGLALTAAFTSACGVDSPTSPWPAATSPTASASATVAAVERPWKGECDIESRFTGPTTVRSIGTCQLAHLGRTTVVTEETISPETATLLTTTTYTAANGDLLYATGKSGLPVINADGTFTITGTWTAVGGTGRFAGASGTAAYVETGRPFPDLGFALASYTLDGLLAY